MLSYHADFEFRHKDSEEFNLASVPFDSDKEPKTNEEFDELAKTLFRSIDGCAELRVLRVYEDSELVRALSNSAPNLGAFEID